MRRPGAERSQSPARANPIAVPNEANATCRVKPISGADRSHSSGADRSQFRAAHRRDTRIRTPTARFPKSTLIPSRNGVVAFSEFGAGGCDLARKALSLGKGPAVSETRSQPPRSGNLRIFPIRSLLAHAARATRPSGSPRDARGITIGVHPDPIRPDRDGPTTPMHQPFDSVLLLAYGAPERMEDVRPFLDNVLRGLPVPKERYEAVVHHYELIGGKSPLNELTGSPGPRPGRRPSATTAWT